MLITMRLGALVRTVLAVVALVVILFLAVRANQGAPANPQPQQPPPTEKAHALQWDRTEVTLAR